MFERPKGGERAVLVQIAFPDFDAEEGLLEFKLLAQSADAQVLDVVTGKRKNPEAKFFIGLGKAEEVKSSVCTHKAELVLVNHSLSPSQQRNLEKFFECRVVDRAGLILDIFAQRARTFEGKLQVELAQLEHLATRLIRGWTHLERQKGGIGLRGPGETQLETDRRLLRERIVAINKRLVKVQQTRAQNRYARKKASLPTVSLVGYTNAGKSSLFNLLTGAHVDAVDKLFATLDPTMRKVDVKGLGPIILADTVGFIKDLPHQLVNAFHATLEETLEADLLLHIIDVSDPNWRCHSKAVNKVLEEIGAKDIKLIKVFNKIDAKANLQPKLDKRAETIKVWVSAKKRLGINLLFEAIITAISDEVIDENIEIGPKDASLRAKLHAINAVVSEEVKQDGGWKLHVHMSKKLKDKLLKP